jgi:hypothetical protein
MPLRVCGVLQAGPFLIRLFFSRDEKSVQLVFFLSSQKGGSDLGDPCNCTNEKIDIFHFPREETFCARSISGPRISTESDCAVMGVCERTVIIYFGPTPARHGRMCFAERKEISTRCAETQND